MDSKGEDRGKRADPKVEGATAVQLRKRAEAVGVCLGYLAASQTNAGEDKDIKMVVVKQGDGFVFTFWSQKDGGLLGTQRV